MYFEKKNFESSQSIRFIMLFVFFLCVQIVAIVGEVHIDPKNDEVYQNSFNQLWHSYIFNTGTHNREELYISNAEVDNFLNVTGVFKWKSLQTKDEVVLAGLGSNFLFVTTYSKENASYAFQEELQSHAVDFSLFEKWDVKMQLIKSFIVVAVCNEDDSCMLKWYQIFDRQLKFLWDWPFHRVINHLNVIKLNNEPKLLIVSHKKSFQRHYSADIYSFSINSFLDIWLFENIILDDTPSSIAVFSYNSNTFLCASFPSLSMVHIFRYSQLSCLETADQKHFKPHQKIFSGGLKSFSSFQTGFHWYLAIASENSSIYKMKDDLLFYHLGKLNLGTLDNWLQIPVGTYREDTVLLSTSNSDTFIMSWMGNEDFEAVGNFTHLICVDDETCLKKTRDISIEESTAFNFDGHLYIITSTKNGTSLYIKLLIKLKPLPDKFTSQLKEILKAKVIFENKFATQREQIEKLSQIGKKIANLEDTINNKTGSTKVFVTSLSNTTNRNPETASHIKNETEIKTTINNLEAEISEMAFDINELEEDIKTHQIVNKEEARDGLLPKNVTDGIVFYDKVLINELFLTDINGYSAEVLLKDSFKKNEGNKIGGVKIIKKLHVEDLKFEKVGETLACDIAYSDDPWDMENGNVVNGDIVWESKLDVLNDFKVLPEDMNNSSSNSKLITQLNKHLFEQLNLEELEITDETYVQGSVNTQPLILPIHRVPLNIHYLDMMNQARIEFINVKKNLEVDFLNGKNFSQLLGQMLLKKNHESSHNHSAKIEGVFFTPFLHANQVNAIDVLKKRTTVDDQSTDWQNEKYSRDVLSSSYEGHKNIKKASDSNLRRTIHVFQNFEINGTLLTENINDLNWLLLNDTVRKDEKTVNVTGVKNFQKPLLTEKSYIESTVNDKFTSDILKNSTDQIIQFPQVFDKVKIKTLSLKGVWNDTCVNCLNETLLRLSNQDAYVGVILFSNDDALNSQSVDVRNSLNNIDLKGENIYQERNVSLENINELKSLKASKVILNGSLQTVGQVNNIDINNFNLLRVSLKYPQIAKREDFRFESAVVDNLNVVRLNDIDISSDLNSEGDTELLDSFLNGKVHRLKKLSVRKGINTVYGVNGLNLYSLLENGISIKTPSFFNGNVVFEEIIHFDNINITNSIEGFSLKKLESDIVFRHPRVFLTGPKNFSTIKVAKDMNIRTLNGHLIQNVVSLKGDEIVKGPVEIHGNVIVQGNITTYGAINDRSVPDMLKTYSTEFNSYIFSDDLKPRNDLIKIKNLVVGGNIQNISFDNTISEAIALKDGYNVTGKKSFNGEVTFKGNVSVENSVNGLNLSQILNDIVYFNKPQKIQGIIIAMEAVLKDLEVRNYFNSSLINNLESSDWIEESIPLNKYDMVNGRKKFEKAHVLQNIEVDFINGHLPSATIPLRSKQYIPSLAFFPRITILENLSVSGLINDINLMKEFEDTVMLTGPQVINGKTLFNNEFFINGNLFVDLVKGKAIDNLITLNSNQSIKSILEFNGTVFIRSNVDDLKTINDINLSFWKEHGVSLNREQVLYGFWTIKGDVKAKGIDGNGLLHEKSISRVSEEVEETRMVASEMRNETEFEYFTQCQKVKNFSKEFMKMPYLFNQFEIAHVLETSSQIESVIMFKINNVDHLIVTFVHDCWSLLYRWKEVDSSFEFMRKINIGFVHKWLVAYRNRTTYLITSSLKENVKCEEEINKGNVWVFNDNSETYGHLLTTKPFVDIVQENNTSGRIFTLLEDGSVYQWTLEENATANLKFLTSVGEGNYRFLDFRVTNGLAVTNGKEIRQINLTNDTMYNGGFPFPNINVVALPINEKTLIASVLRDKVIIYENIFEEKIFSLIHSHKPVSVVWSNHGLEKQAFLIISSQHKLIDVYEYKGVSGFVKKMSLQMSSASLQLVSLSSQEKHQLHKFVLVIQKKKIIFLEMEMLGDFFHGNDSFC